MQDDLLVCTANHRVALCAGTASLYSASRQEMKAKVFGAPVCQPHFGGCQTYDLTFQEQPHKFCY